MRWLAALLLLGSGCADDAANDQSGSSASGSDNAASASASGGQDTGGAAQGGGGQGGAGGGHDACEQATARCESPLPEQAGLGMVALDRCAFGLDRSESFETLSAAARQLEQIATKRSLEDVLGDLNRTPNVIAPSAVAGAPADVLYAFRWEDAENNKLTWVPQGITGSADADASGSVLGRELLLVSFYFDESAAPAEAPKGVRLAIVDVTNRSAPKYRFVLLVEPTVGPNWLPVQIHAGGIAWFGNYLYVADTSRGVRVFDMQRFLEADTSVDEIGCVAGTCRAGLYKYALPQIGAFDRYSACSPAPRFSFIGIDRSGTVPQLVSGEYCSASACTAPLSGRVLRFPLNGQSALPLGLQRTFSSDAHLMGEVQVQGAVSLGDTFLLSSSAPAAGAGVLYRTKLGSSNTHSWSDAPEDLQADGPRGLLWGLSEGVGERAVFAADLATILALP